MDHGSTTKWTTVHQTVSCCVFNPFGLLQHSILPRAKIRLYIKRQSNTILRNRKQYHWTCGMDDSSVCLRGNGQANNWDMRDRIKYTIILLETGGGKLGHLRLNNDLSELTDEE